jgi:hypothetical protein
MEQRPAVGDGAPGEEPQRRQDELVEADRSAERVARQAEDGYSPR